MRKHTKTVSDNVRHGFEMPLQRCVAMEIRQNKNDSSHASPIAADSAAFQLNDRSASLLGPRESKSNGQTSDRARSEYFASF